MAAITVTPPTANGNQLAAPAANGGSRSREPSKERMIPRQLKAPSIKAPKKRYTFSVLEDEGPLSPKTPALIKGRFQRPSFDAGFDAPDPAMSIPTMIDSSVICLQNRLERVQGILRKDPDAFEGEDRKMEFAMINTIYHSVQNVAYHLNKVVRSLNPREEKWKKPVEGVDALDVVSSMRTVMTLCVLGGTKLSQLVRRKKDTVGPKAGKAASTQDVLGEEGVDTLYKIEIVMNSATQKSGILIDRLDKAEKARQMALVQKAATAFMQLRSIGGRGGEAEGNAMLIPCFAGWKKVVAKAKEERELQKQMSADPLEAEGIQPSPRAPRPT